MNKAILMGRLTKDPEVRYTPNNVVYTTFTLAVNRRFAKEGMQQADFINIITWNKTAEFTSMYFKKGQQVGIIGRIQTRSYDDANGVKRYVTDLLGEDYEYTVKIANLSKNYEHQITSNGNVVISKKLGNGSKLPHAGLTKENVALTFLFVAIVVYGNYTMLNMRSKLRRMNKFTK